MNEQKLYAVKNDEGKCWDFRDRDGFWPLCAVFYPATSNKKLAEKAADENGGHVVTLIEEPEKVVLSKEQAEIVEEAHDSYYPAVYIYDNTNLAASGEEELLMKAYVNGYTLAKEKKYYVKVPLVQSQGGLWFFINSDDKLDATYLQGLGKEFTMDEIKENGLQDCEKVEVTDDEQ